MTPANEEEIAEALLGLAAMLQVNVPNEIGLDLMVTALRRLPRPVFLAGRDALVQSHKWPKLPTPGDFLDAGKPTQDQLDSITKVLRSRKETYVRALSLVRVRTNWAKNNAY